MVCWLIKVPQSSDFGTSLFLTISEGVTAEAKLKLYMYKWCEGGLRQQRNDGGGCTTMRERSERVESPVYMCN